MRAQPTARILLTIRNRSWTAHQALAELVDNAFGEKRGRASHVRIAWSPKCRMLTILDDGQGMTDVLDLFTLGQGTESGGQDIGLYGVGGSEALLWLADYAEVTTLREGRVSRGKADWAKCIERQQFPDINNRWRDATVATCPTDLLELGHGTGIALRLRPRLQIHSELIQEKLSRLFAVALRTNRHITWTTLEPHVAMQHLHAWTPGELQDVCSGTVTLANGLAATFTAGRVDGLSIANSKLSVNYVYRQIKETTAGFGRPVQGACGHVDLSGEWLRYLTTTKDDIQEDGREYETTLMAEIAKQLKPLVDQLAAAKRAKIFSNIRINLKQKLEHGFKVLAPRGRTGGSGSEPGSGGEPRPRLPPRPQIHAAVVDILEVGDQDVNGVLCRAIMTETGITAFVNKDHALIVKALEAEPVNQMLLEQVLIAALAKEIMEADALVTFGLLSQRDADALFEHYDGNTWDVFLHVIRVLTDGIESTTEVAP